MKIYKEVEVELHSLLSSALDGGEWVFSHIIFFTQCPLDRRPEMEGGAALGMVVKMKISAPSLVELHSSCP
jgi:hypothetical protein